MNEIKYSLCCGAIALRQGLTTNWYECMRCKKRCSVANNIILTLKPDNEKR